MVTENNGKHTTYQLVATQIIPFSTNFTDMWNCLPNNTIEIQFDVASCKTEKVLLKQKKLLCTERHWKESG